MRKIKIPVSLNFSLIQWASSPSSSPSSSPRTVGYHQCLHATAAPVGLLCHTAHWCGSRYHSWEGQLVVSFLWQLAWCFLVTWKLVLREEAFSSVLEAQVFLSWVLHLNHIISSALGTYLLFPGQPGAITINWVLGERQSLEQSWLATQGRGSQAWCCGFC